VEKFALQEDRDTDLFARVAPLEVSAYLRTWLDEFAPVAIAVNSELARSVYIIGPVLAEAKRQSKGPANVFPGYALDVERERGLNGYCDYLISRSAEYYYLRRPLIAVVEAKREDIIGGLGQCAAALVAVRLFNERDGTPIPAVYGCVTSGTNWQFLKLEGGRLNVDHPEYYLRDVGKIVGILVSILGEGESV
jgi:hypothetical protein